MFIALGLIADFSLPIVWSLVATIPIGISEAQREGRIQPGTTVLFAAFGAGFTWGAAVVRF